MEQGKQRPASTSCNTLLQSPTPVSGLRLKGERATLIDSVPPHHTHTVSKVSPLTLGCVVEFCVKADS